MKALTRAAYLVYEICIALPIILLATILTAIVTIIGGVFGNPDFWGYYPGMIWSRIICKSLLLPVTVTGQENIETGRPYIIVANHQSAFDIFLLYGYIGIRFKWLMKKELARIPLVGTACTKAGFIYIDRSSRVNSMGSIDKAAETLQHGMSMAIFPEGTRSADGRMGRFKKGAFLLAEDLMIPVLPVTIGGAFEVMSKHSKTVSWHPLSLTIHEPIQPTDMSGLDETEKNNAIKALAIKAENAIGGN